MIEQLDPLAKTALWTAAMRAREHGRPDRLFSDPLAGALAGEEGPLIMKSFEADVQGAVEDPALAVRTRFFDDIMSRLAHAEKATQIILVGAGMDTRAFRMSWPDGTTFFELDRPALLDLKDKILAASTAAATCKRIPLGVDLTRDWTSLLLETQFCKEVRSTWLVEGLLYFLTARERDTLIRGISELASPGSWLLADYVSQHHLESPAMLAWREEMAAKKHAWQSGCDDPVSWLDDYGWQATISYYGDRDADYGRWADADIKPGVPGTRGRYLIAARRNAETASAEENHAATM